MKRYKKWQGIKAPMVPVAKRDGVTVVGQGWVEFADPFGMSVYEELFDKGGNFRAIKVEPHDRSDH